MTRTVEYTFHTTVDSSALTDIYYNIETKELFVRFPRGNYAGYLNVPAGRVEGLVNASSVGRYYSSNIKGVFTGTSGDVNLVEKRTVPVVAAVSSKSRFIVRGVVSVEDDVYATSVEDAVAQFLAENGEDAKVSEVVVRF